MYIVTFGQSFKISTKADNLYFRSNRTSIPLSEDELVNLMVRCQVYRFRNQLFANKTGAFVGSILFDEGFTRVELEPIEVVKRVRKVAPKVIKTTPVKPPKPDDLITFEEAEKLLIMKALSCSQGVRIRSSKLLGICVRSIRLKIRKYNIKCDNFDDSELNGIVTIKEFQKKLLIKALGYTKGNQSESAKLLGISARGIQNKIREYDIDAKCYL